MINKSCEFTKNDNKNNNKKVHENLLDAFTNIKNTLTNVNWRGSDIRNSEFNNFN